MEIQICRSIKKTTRDVWNLLLLAFIDDFIPREPLHLLKQIVKMQTEVRVNYLNCHIHVPSKHVLANREANSRHTFDVTIWLSRTTDNSNIFIRSREVRDNESRLYSTSSLMSSKTVQAVNSQLAKISGSKTFFYKSVWCAKMYM